MFLIIFSVRLVLSKKKKKKKIVFTFCVLSEQLPKQETVKTAESRITAVIFLKHTLELVEPLQAAVEPCKNPLFKAYHKVRLSLIL